MKISQDEIALLFPDGLPVELAKVIFPEMSEPLTSDEIRFLMKFVALDREFTIGPKTLERVFNAAGLVNMSDLQAVLDAVERALDRSPHEWKRDGNMIVDKNGAVVCLMCESDSFGGLHTAHNADKNAAIILQSPKVKPLDWKRGEYISSAKSVDTLSFVAQRASRHMNDWVLHSYLTTETKKTVHSSREEAEAAAQEQHERAVGKYLQG